MDLYREEILDHYKNPHNFGRLSKPDVVVREANALCGDMIEMSFSFSQNSEKEVKAVKFKSIGCAISTASASILTDYLKGKKISHLKNLKEEDILALIDLKITPARMKCLLLPLLALKKALHEI